MRRVLLVEDNADIRTLLIELLQEAGYEVDGAWSFADAKVKLQQGGFALLVANVLLPGGGSGAELAAIAESKGMKHLLVTGHPEQMQLLEIGKKPYMAKPIRGADFVAQVNRLCDGD